MAPKDEGNNKTTTTSSSSSKQKDDLKKSKEENVESTLSEEDKELKERLETCVATVLNQDDEASVPIRLQALQVIVTELRTATSSMTSVPKPLKFLRPHYASLQKMYKGLKTTIDDKESLELRARLADVLAVLAMTMGQADKRESLNYKLESAKDYEALASRHEYKHDEAEWLGSWGHEFVRSLAGEIGEEYNVRLTNQLEAITDPNDDEPFEDLLHMVRQIVPFHVTHNAEAEAVDLLIEVQRLKSCLLTMDHLIDETNYHRICLYLIKTADYMSDPDDWMELLETAYELYRRQEQYYDALRVALKMDQSIQDTKARVLTLLKQCPDDLMKKQMALLLARQGVVFVDSDHEDNEDATAVLEELQEYMSNEWRSEHYLKLAQDLDVMDPKTPQDIYKSHLADSGMGGFSRRRTSSDSSNVAVDSARANLASTFVNAMVNAGFGQDKLLMPNNHEWLYKNKDHGMMSAAASLGLILLWNVDEGLTHIDKFLYSSDEYVKAGAALAVGLLSTNVRNDADPALALLSEHVSSSSNAMMTCAACTGLGIAYAGTAREDACELVLPVLEQRDDMMQVSLAGLALGMIFVGTCDDTVGGAMVQRLMEASDEDLEHSHSRFLYLGLALLFLGQAEKADAMMEALRTISHSSSQYGVLLLETCAYAGSGNVLKIQDMLHQCAEHLTEKAEHQMAAVIGIGLIAMGEHVGAEMALRTYDHLLHYCEPPIKRAVPLSLAILHVSHPEFAVVDQLSRLSHDPDPELSQNAILALGLVSAGTNHSRVAGLLRQLSEFYAKEAGHVFCVRIAQGLLHLGKGLLTLNPYHSDRMLWHRPALGSLLIVLHSCLDLKRTLLDKTHYLLFYLACAMHPRMLMTVDGDMQWKPVTVRVGQAVETVGQAGKPKRITGFQTHTTPVLLGVTERAELATEEFLSIGNVLEGLVLLKENPDYEPEETTK